MPPPPTLVPRLFDAARLQNPELSTADYRELLKDAHQQLQTEFDNGTCIRLLVSARAEAVDDILRHLWNAAGFNTQGELALLAVGGYGRGELHPYSDIDVLILHNLPALPAGLQDAVSAFIARLWDLGLDIGSSVRSMEECVEGVGEDITIATNLLEVRTLCGPDSLRQTLLRLTRSLWTGIAFFEAKKEEQLERHAKHNFTEYNLEPDLKNAPGGLRDIQTIAWVAKRHFDATTLYDLVNHGFLTEFEYRQLMEGEAFLWRVRFLLHMLARRNENRLLFDYQKTLANLLGYTDSNANRAVEQFMKAYYRAAMNLSMLNEMLLQYFDETILKTAEENEIIPVNDHFQLRDKHIEVRHHQVFAKHPSALLEIFLILAENTLIQGVRASTIRLIWWKPAKSMTISAITRAIVNCSSISCARRTPCFPPCGA